MPTQKPLVLTFSTKAELRLIETIKALTFCRSSKTAILRIAESYDKIMKECSDLKRELREHQRSNES